MRSIKFRVWDKQFNKWVEPDVVHICAATGEAKGKRGGSGYVDTWELMQYTGLKDKNGKEIYEGDILQKNCLPKKGYVKFVDGCFFIQYEHDSNFIASRNAFEIIGNIYESPELVTT